MTRRWFARPFGLVVFTLLVSLAASVAAVGQTWELGTPRFSTNAGAAAPPLRIQAAGRATLGSFKFLGRVGGVSFEAIAQPDSSLAGKAIELSYDPKRPDGSRLVVRAGSTVLRTDIPDWQLQPIVNFANDPYSAVVSCSAKAPTQSDIIMFNITRL